MTEGVVSTEFKVQKKKDLVLVAADEWSRLVTKTRGADRFETLMDKMSYISEQNKVLLSQNEFLISLMHDLNAKIEALELIRYKLVDNVVRFFFVPFAIGAFIVGLLSYLYFNVSLGFGFIGTGVTSLLLTLIFAHTKSSLK